jgi:excisionase family DNA binding protein
MQASAGSVEKPQLSTFEVARELSLSAPTVRSLVKSGALRAWRFGKCFKFSRAAVEEYKQRQEISPLAV